MTFSPQSNRRAGQTERLTKWVFSAFLGIIGAIVFACTAYFVFESGVMIAIYASFVPVVFSVVVAASV